MAGALAALGLLVSCALSRLPEQQPLPSTALREVVLPATPALPRLSAVRAGDPAGRRVLFVHGTPGEASAWAAYLADVPAGFEYVAVDRPGFGQSEPRDAVTALAAQAALLAPLLVERRGQQTILVGHSLGGPIVAQVAADFPEQVGALVIVAGSLDPALEEILFIQRVGEAWPFVHLLPRSLRNANREILALEPELRALKPRLGAIVQPVIIIHGTKDGLVPFANVPFMEEAFRSARSRETIVLDGANHFLPWNAKPTIDAAILKAAHLS